MLYPIGSRLLPPTATNYKKFRWISNTEIQLKKARTILKKHKSCNFFKSTGHEMTRVSIRSDFSAQGVYKTNSFYLVITAPNQERSFIHSSVRAKSRCFANLSLSSLVPRQQPRTDGIQIGTTFGKASLTKMSPRLLPPKLQRPRPSKRPAVTQRPILSA